MALLAETQGEEGTRTLKARAQLADALIELKGETQCMMKSQ